MDKPNRHAGEFVKDQYGDVDEEDNAIYQLYDDAWRSEESEATTLHEVPLDYMEKEDSKNEDTVNNAITEVSEDFLSGRRTNCGSGHYGESDESHVSDAEFKLVTGTAYYAHYPETAAGLSDNDWNPYGTESDTNISPRIPLHASSEAKLSDSKLLPLTSFNPPMHSTDLNVNSPSAAVHSILDSSAHLTGINEQSEDDTVFSLKPDITANFSPISQGSEKAFSLQEPIAKTPLRQIDLNKTIRGNELDASSVKSALYTHDRTQLDEKISFKGPESSGKQWPKTEPENYQIGIRNMSSMERSKSHGIAKEAASKSHVNNSNCYDLSHEEKVDDSRDKMSRKYDRFQNLEYVDHREGLGKGYQTVMSDTHHLRKTNSKFMSTCIDYSLLQRDLQDIQDSLQHTQGAELRQSLHGHAGRVKSQSGEEIPHQIVLSDSESDIIPSTTSTPERHTNRIGWEFADLGFQHPDNFMPNISQENYTTNSLRPPDEKITYNSDGDETRTSGSSERIVDLAPSDQVLAEMSQILHPQTRCNSFGNVDEMLTSFRNQRRQIESRYQQLDNQGLAEKVYRILTSQHPGSQANGILSEVSAREMEMRTQFAVNLHKKDFNFSAISPNLDETTQGNLALPDNVRKQLDLSGLSSAEASKLADVSSLRVSSNKRFTALDGMAKLLSAQVAKASERTFNQSLDVIVPQNVVQCYPLLADNKQWDKTRSDREEVNRAPADSAEDGANRDVESDQPGHPSSVTGFYAEQQRQSNNTTAHSFDDSDSSSGKRREKYRPYRPAGSKDVYYTESDVASAADSTTTMESTHFGSDDARGPLLPPGTLGSRQDAPSVVGIYGTRKPLISLQEEEILPPIQEKSGLDERESDANQSYKGGRTSEGHKPQEKSLDASANDASRRNILDMQQHESNIQSQEESMAQSAQGSSKDRGASSFHIDLSNPGTDRSHDIVHARSTERWADTRAKMENEELMKRSRSTDHSENKVQDLERVDRKDSLSGQYRFDKFDMLDREGKNQQSDGYYRRSRDAVTYSDYSHPQEDRNLRPLLQRLHVFHDDDSSTLNADQKYTFRDLSTSRERSCSAGDIVSPSALRLQSGRSLRSSYDDNERPYSPQNTHSVPVKRPASLHRAHSDKDLYNAVRDVHLSPAFHRALSPELRQAIENRSPILSRQIERSLRQPPAEPPSHGHRSKDRTLHGGRELARSLSPPPTFQARERGQVLREYTFQARQPSTSRAEEDYHWSQQFQKRSRSPTLRQEDMGPHAIYAKSGNPAESQSEMTLKDESPYSDEVKLDQEPVSMRAQLLTQALSQEKESEIRPDIGFLWEQFKASNESYDSSMNTPRLEAITDLLKNPSPHLVAQCLREHDEHLIKRQERAELEREKRRMEKWLEHHLMHQSSSEEEISVAYARLLAHKEKERMRRRMAKKKKGKSASTGESKSEVTSAENFPDSLFSIPEDASFEQSPNKSAPSASFQKQKVFRRPHVIDPNMRKLRERIARQKLKIDKQALKELQRMEKLKKLEHLLAAKKQGEISDQTLQIQLDEISSTSTPGSDNSQEVLDRCSVNRSTTPLSDDSTTAKDSSTEMRARKMEKTVRRKEMKITDLENSSRHRGIQTGKGRNGSPAGHCRENTNSNYSECQLLRLVKDGYLTPEKAYRLALEREASVKGISSHESSYRSSSDEHGNNNGRLHRFYSPYSRDDYHHSHFHHVPKLKFTPSLSDATSMTYPHVGYRHYHGQGLRNVSAADRNDSHTIDSHSRNSYIHSKSPQKLSDTGSRERLAIPVPSVSESMWQENKKGHGIIPDGSQIQQTFSPNRHEKRQSPSRLSPPRQYYRFGPARTRSPSPKLKATSRRHSPSNSQEFNHNSTRYKSHKSENESPYRKKISERRGVAWHIPVDLHPSLWEVPKARASAALPLQEKKVNGQSKKTFERAQQRVEVEPLQGWQKERKEDDIWQKERKPDDIWQKERKVDDIRQKERKADDIRRKRDHPWGIPNELWKHIVHNDPLASKNNHWEVDPLMDRVQYILSKHTGDSSTEDEKKSWNKKSTSNMSLQEAFLAHKQDFISRCKERQKRLALASEYRQMQECMRLEREAIFMDQDRVMPANLDTHPYSDNLYQPKKRYFSKQEMKDLTMKRYKKLPEVIKKQELDKRNEECKLNRLRVSIFNRKVQRDLLRKKSMRWR